MTDDKAVEIMARGMYEDPNDPTVVNWEDLSDFVRDNWRALATPALAALRAEGAEVVFWRPISEVGTIGPSDGYVIREHATKPGSYFAILRGPEVQK